MQQPLRRLAVFSCLLLTALLGACGEERPTVFAEAGTMDAPEDIPDVPLRPDLEARDAQGRVCTRSSQCDDGIPCTMDFCSADGRCVSTPDTMACDDGVYCNGQEYCDVRRGCVRGTPVSCNDNYTCTIDRCDEETKRCVHSPRDFDHDGDPDIRCRAAECDDGGVDADPDGGGACWIGGDCDDSNPRVNSRLPELCGDMIDNNCNGFVDNAEPGGCAQPPHDTCDDPLDVSAGGRFTFQTLGTTGNYMFRCAGGMLMRDVVARLRLTEARDVTLSASSQGGAVYLQLMANVCGTSSNTMDYRACTLGFPSTVRKRSLPAGDYYVLLGTSSSPAVSAEFELNVTLSTATPAPANDTCAAPTVIPPTGGTFHGDLVDLASDVSIQCAGRQPDAVYSITLSETSNIVARLTTTPSSTIGLALVDRCVASPMTLRCDYAAPAQWIARELAAGTYYLVVSGSTLNPYTLDVMVTPPSPPPQGDSCANPLTLTPGTPVMGSLAMMEADYQLSCSGTGNRDVVYRFTLSERRDVNVLVTGSSSEYFYLALQSMCGVRTSDRACRFGQPGRLTVRGLDPGTYYLVIKGTRGGDYTLTLDATPPVTPVEVTGNDTCESAAVIPSGGGVFTGTTATARRDYSAPCSPASTSEDVVFRYRVERMQRVSFSLDGSSYDTLMWLTSGPMCPGTNVPGGCNDDAIGVASAFDLTLAPGDYYLFVSGWGSSSRGNYVLTVTAASL